MGVSLEGVILQGFYYAKKEEGGIPMAGRKPKPTAVKKLEGNYKCQHQNVHFDVDIYTQGQKMNKF